MCVGVDHILDNGDGGSLALKRLFPLAAIEIFVWFVLLVTILIISKGVFSINFGTRSILLVIATQLSKILGTGVLVFVWLVSWKKIADVYLKRALSRKRATV